MKSRWLAYSLALLVPIVLGQACKSEGGSDTGSSFLQIVETAPTDDQPEVPVETRIGFRIDAPIDPATLTGETFFLTDDQGTRLPNTVVIGDEPDIAELKPEGPLDVITSYTVTVTTGLASTGGATLEKDFEWKFTTLDSEWGVWEWLEQIGTGSSDQHQVSVDGQSNALAVWEYTEPDATRIWAAHYDRVDLWGAPEPIDDGDQVSTNPRLATDDAGNGFAVWEQTGGALGTNIWTNRYAVDEGWGTPALLQNGEVTAARIPSVAADPAGNAIAVWVQRELNSANQVVWANRYEPGSGWGAAASIDPTPTLTAGIRTAVGMDADGNAIAVWARPTVPSAGGRGEVLWANRYAAGMGWGPAELIKPDPDTRARNERLAVGPNGDAFVVWVQNDESRPGIEDIWSVRFSGSSWGAPERIDDYDAGNKKEPDIAVDGSGVAHAVWSQADSDFENIWATQYTPGSDWGAPELIEPPNDDPNEDGGATTPRLGINAAGNTFVVWRQIWKNWGSIWSNRLDPGTGWMTAERIEDAERPAKLPKVAVDNNRHAHAVWLHGIDIGIDWVRTNRFE